MGSGPDAPIDHGSTVDFFRVFDLSNSPHMILDRELRFVAVNRSYEKVTMRAREELIGNKLFDMFPESSDAQDRLNASIVAAFETGEPDTIALIPYELDRPAAQGGGREVRYWSATHTPLVDDGGRVVYVIQNTNDVTAIAKMRPPGQPPADHAATAELALWRNAEAVEEAYQQTLAENEEFHRLFSQAPGMIAVFEGREMLATFVSDTFSRFVGRRPIVARPLLEAVPELVGQDFVAMLTEATETGASVTREGLPIHMRRSPDHLDETSYVDFFCNPVRDANGTIYGVFVQGVDRTEAMRASHHQRMLMDELNHRVKNTLATIQSMARQSFRDPADLDDARYAFEARIMALSRVHNVLADRRWEAVPLTALFCGNAQGIDPARIDCRGEDLLLSPKTGVALAIVSHELLSNAKRHGALREADGHVQISWACDHAAGDRLTVTWREFRPTVSGASLRPGMGMRILRSIVEGELAGSLAIELTETGLICTFEVGLTEAAGIAV
ncbi:PAS domain-containing protein [Jiella sp. CBK1P-4]|uniref:Blue-light-activated histidine kinase n=1 Tax=Jiella avicenniae TaxID=2907202 RepID=A0A9X1P2E0_9HYPH|nr:PAS domain-containing protein [Jiella avicenniae]